MKLFILFFLASWIFFFCSCIKEEVFEVPVTNSCKVEVIPNMVTITGRLVNNCEEKLPIPRVKLNIWGKICFCDCVIPDLHTYTEEDGSFTLTFDRSKVCSYGHALSIGYINKSGDKVPLLNRIDVSGISELNDVTIYSKHERKFLYRVKTTADDYSSLDSLFVYQYTAINRPERYKVFTGPFINDQIIDEAIATYVPSHRIFEQCYGHNGYIKKVNGDVIWLNTFKAGNCNDCQTTYIDIDLDSVIVYF